MYLIILLLSMWQSILFWHKEPGISVILFVLPLIVFLIKYLEKTGKIKNTNAGLIAIPILLLSATFFIFNNEFLNSVNTLAIPGLIVLMVMELICDKFTLEKPLSNVLGFLFKPIGYVEVVGKKIVGKIKKEENKEKIKPKNIKRILKAIALSLPLIFLVFILLVTADSDFAKLFVDVLENAFEILEELKISNITGRIIGIILVFFYLAAFTENIVLTKDIERNNKEVSKKDSLTIKMIITILNLMYLVFCIIQVKSLINLHTMDKTNYSYSYYARQGFFQLMVVSAINLVMVLKSKSNCYKKEKYIKIMDLIMVMLTGAILVFSFIRMYIYQQSFGFTLKRILVFWAQFTEAILLIPTVMYILDKKIDLAKTYFIIVVTMYVGLNFANINRIIAKKNVDMNLKKGSISGSDMYYLTQLGTDAVPEMEKLYEIVEKDDQSYILDPEKFKAIRKKIVVKCSEYYSTNKDFLNNKLLEIKSELENLEWQEFNISKYRAKKILEGK